MLELKNISKSFNNSTVLKDINIQLQDGEVYGLIGKNGAGKTTLMNIISQVYTCDTGEIILNGVKITSQNDLSQKLGYIIDIPASFEYLTAKEYLEFLICPLALSKGAGEMLIDKALATVNLRDINDKKIKTFSRGMKQRLGIAAGLIFNPTLIIMDEPSSALDPEGRLEVLKIIENLKSQGKTIMLSTHILNDVERVCDRIGLIVNGKIVIEGKTVDIMNKYSTQTIIIECPPEDREAGKQTLSALEYVESVSDYSLGLEITYKDGSRQKVFSQAIKACKNLTSIQLKRVSIEEVFMMENLNKEND